VGWGVMYWINFVKDRDGWQVLVNAVINLRESKNSKEFLE